jgi:pimeloyl-ACP methyl ester carboxylesterase
MATDARPPVVIIGGFLSSPPLLEPLRQRLLARGAGAVDIAPIWLPDWLLVYWRGQGPIATRAARTVREASRRADGVPLLVVGHSAGGVIARILTAEAPFAGRRFAGSSRIGAIVTLGSPHVNAWEAWTSRRSGVYPARFAAEHVPGAFFAPRVGYVSVASRWATARSGATEPRERWLRRSYERIMPPPHPEVIEGDGVIPVGCALLPGARHIVLDGAAHGHGTWHPWYGSEEWVDTWWPAAVEAWRDAQAARAAGP